MGQLGAFNGCDILIGAGAMSTILGVSPVKLIVDTMATRILKRIVAGVKVDDDTLGWKEIMDVKIGGQFLDRPHTLKHCREAARLGILANADLETWKTDGGKGLHDRALDRYREIKKGLKPLDLPGEVKNELERIVKTADAKLAK